MGLNEPCRRLSFGFCLGFLILCFVGQDAIAAQPVRFNYQAKLTNSSGAPLTGTHTIFLCLWDGGTSAVADSGTLVYAESFSAELQDGVLNHAVGTGTPFSGSLAPSLFDSNNDIFVQLSIDTLGNVVLPRSRFESVPFAVHAISAENAGGVPAGLLTLSDSPVAPAGFTATGTRMFQSWFRRQPLLLGAYSFGAAAANAKIYICGGYYQFIGPSNFTFIVDPYNETTTAGATMPTGRQRLTATELNGIIYAVGGTDGGNNRTVTNEAYDPLAGPQGTWTTKQPLTFVIADHAAAAANGHLYLFGGTTNAGTTDTTVEYTPGSDTWAVKASLPAPRSGCSAAEIDGKIYVTGGSSAATYQYDPVANAWEVRSPLPVKTDNGALVSAAGRLYYLGGTSVASSQDVWVYDPNLDAWSAGPTLPTVRSLHAAAAADGTIYVLGGNDETGTYGKRVDALNAGTYYVMRKN